MKKANEKLIFLGMSDFCKTDEKHPYFETPITLSNLGFGRSIAIYPANLENFTFHFLVHEELQDFEIILSGQKNKDLKINAAIKAEKIKQSDSSIINPNWSYISFQLNGQSLPEPEVIDVFLKEDHSVEKISELHFRFHELEKLTKEELLAIESNLYMAQKVRAMIQCKYCKDNIVIYFSTKRDYALESESMIFLNDAPDRFECQCRKTNTDLRFLKKNLAQTLRGSKDSASNYNYESIYTESALNKLTKRFLEIIHSSPAEEEVQKFIEDNPILLSHFNPKKIKFKTRISDKYVTDFSILDTNNNLILIEIEKPQTSLFKKDGHAKSEFNHAYEQVTDWLYELKSSRASLLDNFGLKQHQVNEIKGFVIAGLTQNEKDEHLRRHKIQKNPLDPVKFMTFDELLSSTVNSIRTFLERSMD